MGSCSFRPLLRSDLALLQTWLAEPHVDEWWHQRLDLPGLEEKYGPRIDGIEPVHVFVIEQDQQPIGWIQWYRWADFPEHATQLAAGNDAAGLDLAIGELASIGKGFGPEIIRRFVSDVVRAEPGIAAVVTDVEERNRQSLRAFEKAGFIPTARVQVRQEKVWRRVMRLSFHPRV